MSDLSGKHALVTGGGTGIGLGIAVRLLEAGAKVTIAGRREDVLETAASDLQSLCDNPDNIQIAVCDVTNEDDVQRAVAVASNADGLQSTVAADLALEAPDGVDKILDTRRTTRHISGHRHEAADILHLRRGIIEATRLRRGTGRPIGDGTCATTKGDNPF